MSGRVYVRITLVNMGKLFGFTYCPFSISREIRLYAILVGFRAGSNYVGSTTIVLATLCALVFDS